MLLRHLVVELGSDAQEEVHVEVVVMRDERLGGCPARNHVHERRLHLEEAHLVEEVAHVADDLGASDELVAHRLVHDQVQVALSVARFLQSQQRHALAHN